MHPAVLLGFGLAVAPLVMTPGASFTLTTTYAAERRLGAVAGCIAGTGFGVLTHGLLAAVGLSALVMRSAEAYRVVQVAGATYLVILGLTMLCRRSPATVPGREVRTRRVRVKSPLATGYLANVLNPKAAGVYLTLAPQFLPNGPVQVQDMIVLASVHVILMAAWLGVLGLALARVVARAGVRSLLQYLRRIGGAALVTLGVRAAVAS